MNISAILPIKRFDQAKSRLAPVLNIAQRASLAASMYCDVLETLTAVPSLTNILVVTNDDRAAEIAHRAGACVLVDCAQDGTNHAVQLGLARLRQGREGGAIVVPGDIPFATVREIERVLGDLSTHDAVLVPAVRDGGTNILGLSRTDTIGVAFGMNSFNRHLAAVRAAGIAPRILRLEGAGHDIDVPSDLFCSEGDGPAPRTRAFLTELGRHAPPRSDTMFKEICSHE